MIFHIDIDAFFASVEEGFNPLLYNKPVIVGGLAHERGCVHTASYEARRRGIYTGMSLKEAKRLCPDAVFLKGNFRQYRAAAITLENIFRSFTPVVEVSSLDDAYLDMRGLIRYYRSFTDAALKIKNRIREELNITASIGIASSKLVARIASGIHKPDGLVEVAPGNESSILCPLPIEKLRGIGRKSKEKLKDLGIKTIGEMRGLSKITLVQILGSSSAEEIWEYALGRDKREVNRKELPKQISRETSFEEDVDAEEIIIGTIRYLCERIAKKLREFNLKARRVRLRIRYSDNRSVEKFLTRDPASDDGIEIFTRLVFLYRNLNIRRVRVKHVSIAVSELVCTDRQIQIFTNTDKMKDLNLHVDEARNNFGFTSVFYADTLVLKTKYKMEKHGYILHTPALSQ